MSLRDGRGTASGCNPATEHLVKQYLAEFWIIWTILQIRLSGKDVTMRPSRRKRVSKQVDRCSRRLRIEALEDRRMLTMADIVFLADESGSEGPTHVWLSGLISGDTDNDGNQDIASLAERLAAQGVDDVRYGLVGFGQSGRFAHSHVVGTNPGTQFERLWSDGVTAADHTTDLKAAIANLVADGGWEDGWDAIDHAIAEYDFRIGAVSMFILLQGESPRLVLPSEGGNVSLTHDSVLSALRSKNVVLNTITVSGETAGSNQLFNLSPYGQNNEIQVLGVDADGAGSGAHTFHWIDINSSNSTPDVPNATSAEALQISYNGSNTGASGMVASGKSILFGQSISGGIGPSTAGYRAKSVPFQMVDMTSGTTTVTPGTAVTFPVTAGFAPGFTFMAQRTRRKFCL